MTQDEKFKTLGALVICATVSAILAIELQNLFFLIPYGLSLFLAILITTD